MKNKDMNFEVNDALKIEGFDPNEFARPYDENPDEHYLPYDVQRWWFGQVYPNGRIVVSKPEPDSERTPGAYVATAMIWKDKNDEKEDITISNRAVPSETNTVDPYQDCQRKAISLALKTLGFWITPSKVVVKPMVNPDEKGLVQGAIVNAEVPVPETKVEETTVIEEKVEAPAEAPKKRGRKPKVAEDVAEVADPVETPVVEETPATIVPETVPATTEAPVPAEVEETMEAEEAPKSNLMPLDEARATVISYRNFAGRTIGELADSGNQKDHELLVWFATSARAAVKYEKEVAAAQAVLANEK